MPRLYTGSNDPLDFCVDCWPTEAEAEEEYGEGEGPDNRGNCFAYDVDHPEYDGFPYLCEICWKILTEKDEYA